MSDYLTEYDKNAAKPKEEKRDYWWTVEFSIVPGINGSEDEERLSTVAAISGARGSEIFFEEIPGTKGKLFLKAEYNSSVEIDELAYMLDEILHEPDFSKIQLARCYKTYNRAWDTQHIEAFPPLNIGKSLVVMAPWHETKEIQGDRMPIYIFPASAFGTGYHESTRIALELLEPVVKFGDVIIDVGTGTGILFITALKLGAGHAIARDIDPSTLDEARRNMALNGISPNVCNLSEGDLLKGVKEKTNILTANILLMPNIAMLPDVAGVLKPKGYAIFSGMTVVEKATFVSVLNSSGLEIERELKSGDWWGCRAVRSWG